MCGGQRASRSGRSSLANYLPEGDLPTSFGGSKLEDIRSMKALGTPPKCVTHSEFSIDLYDCIQLTCYTCLAIHRVRQQEVPWTQ